MASNTAGLQIYSSQGELRVDLTKRISRVVEVFEVAASSQGEKIYALGDSLHAVSLPVNGYLVPPKVVVEGNAVRWSPGTSTFDGQRGAGRIMVFTI